VINAGFVTDDTVAIDATHFEARDQAPPKEEKSDTEPKKRGRKSKEEREQWLIEKTKREANLPLFEKKIEDQLTVPIAELRAKIPQDPQLGVKKNSEGKNEFWYGYKGHFAAGTKANTFFNLSSLRAI
jgi:transposase